MYIWSTYVIVIYNVLTESYGMYKLPTDAVVQYSVSTDVYGDVKMAKRRM